MPHDAMVTESPRVWLLEDDRQFRKPFVAWLDACGFRVTCFDSIEAMRAALAAQAPLPDVTLLDLELPDGDAIVLVPALARLNVAVVVLSGRRDPRSRVQLLDEGADAYLCKPVDPDEATATIRAVLRRCRPSPSAGPDYWILDLGRGSLLHASQPGSLKLSQREMLLLDAFARSDAESIETHVLLGLLGLEADQRYRLEVALSRLRRRCRKRFGIAPPIRALYGKGYACVSELRSVH